MGIWHSCPLINMGGFASLWACKKNQNYHPQKKPDIKSGFKCRTNKLFKLGLRLPKINRHK